MDTVKYHCSKHGSVGRYETGDANRPDSAQGCPIPEGIASTPCGLPLKVAQYITST